jgi:hypothetical protein
MAPLREVADTWSSLYSNSPALRSVVSFLHVGGLVSGGGYAIATDLGTLKAIRLGRGTLALELDRLGAAHRIVIGSLAVVLASGLLLMLADLDAYLESTAFWIKMALIVCLAINGAAMIRAGASAKRDDARVVARLRFVAIASLALWMATTFMGAVLPNGL